MIQDILRGMAIFSRSLHGNFSIPLYPKCVIICVYNKGSGSLTSLPVNRLNGDRLERRPLVPIIKNDLHAMKRILYDTGP